MAALVLMNGGNGPKSTSGETINPVLNLLLASDFLLFIPVHRPNLKAVLSYYSAAVVLNLEGDVQVGHEAIESLGTLFFFSV